MNTKAAFFTLCLCFMLCNVGVSAQSYDEFKERVDRNFRQFQENVDRQYDSYRERINAQYADFMRRNWTLYDVKPAMPAPSVPEPPKPAVKDPETDITEHKAAPKPVVVPPPAPAPKPEPVVERKPQGTPSPSVPVGRGFSFDYYGISCDVSYSSALRFRLESLSENTVADKWNALTVNESEALLKSCLEWKQRLGLCDWGYVRFIQKMTEAFFGPGQPNEACLMQMYLLAQSGYMVRIAKTGGKLVLMLPFNNEIWQYQYLAVGNTKYFLIDQDSDHSSVYLFDHEFPNEKMFSLQMTSSPKLGGASKNARSYASKKYPAASVSVSVNSNLIDFYRDYPLGNDLDIYPRASLSESAKSQIYPVLRQAISGATEFESVEILLNFVQTAFSYRTDDEQFGFEKPLFPDESLYYPYCDCEDRSILFSVLVHDLTGLDVKLINYPNHIATAVRFTESVSKGYYYELAEGRYTMCDPTYIGAGVGEVMPEFENTAATVIGIW